MSHLIRSPLFANSASLSLVVKELKAECGIRYYLILSSEIMESISAIKVVSIYSEMIWYHFTVG